jgi:hypothetical protein
VCALPIVTALFLFASGILAIVSPRTLVVGHARYGTRIVTVSPSSLEFVSKTGCRNYGILAIIAGTVITWGALGASHVPLTDRGIAKSIVRTKKTLESSYGVTEGCTIAQIEAAVRSSKVSPRHLPYLCAAFMGEDEFDQLRASMPDVNWAGIAERVSKIASELPYSELSGSHFHETWIPTVDK